jgi:hypothetical protein
VPIAGESPQIMNPDLDKPDLARPAHDAVVKRTAKELRKDGQDVELNH